MLNILNEPVIRADASGDSRVEASLPEVYAMLMADEVDAFPALRPHQRHAWHAFLVQLGAMAIHRGGLAEPPSARALALVAGRSARCFCPAHPGRARSTPPEDTRTRPTRHTRPASLRRGRTTAPIRETRRGGLFA